MVEVSKLKSLDIYTNAGHYVGRVEDIILNIRLGTISKLQVRAVEHVDNPTSARNQFINLIRGVPEEQTGPRSYQNDLLTIDFDKVQAIGDIMLINPRDMKKVNPEPQVPESVSPNPQPAQSEVKPRIEQERL